jgi:hypothetical protein
VHEVGWHFRSFGDPIDTVQSRMLALQIIGAIASSSGR